MNFDNCLGNQVSGSMFSHGLSLSVSAPSCLCLGRVIHSYFFILGTRFMAHDPLDPPPPSQKKKKKKKKKNTHTHLTYPPTYQVSKVHDALSRILLQGVRGISPNFFYFPLLLWLGVTHLVALIGLRSRETSAC